MSDYKNKSYFKRKYNIQEEKCTESVNLRMHSDKKIEESKLGSQNFCLRWSQDSVVSDTQDVITNTEKDVIVISDSSFKSTPPNSTYSSKTKSTSQKQCNMSNEIYILESSDSNSTDDENERFLQAWKANRKPALISYKERKDIKKNISLYTSDESSSNSISHYRRYVKSPDKTSSSSINSASENVIKNEEKSNIRLCNNTVNKVNPLSNGTSTSNTNSSSNSNSNSNSNTKNSKHNEQVSTSLLPVNKMYTNFKKHLSQKDFQRIIKNIKSTNMIYQSPKNLIDNNVTLNKGVINDIIHPSVSPENNVKVNNAIIDETSVDSESDIIQNSQVNSENVCKTYKDHQCLNAPIMNKEIEITCNELSDRKKKQISQWLMTTSPNPQSDTSTSIVSPTNKDDTSSGNSSLERLEMNYETPNNRGKIHRTIMNENRTENLHSNKKSNSTVLRQATLKELIQSKNNTPKLHTLKNKCNDNDKLSTPVVNIPQEVVITDCVDILDKLYGKSWHAKADVLFPKSEPQKQVIPKRNRAVQTERKSKNKGKCYITDSEDDDSNTSSKDLKLQNQLKKSARKDAKQKDSFINNESLSENESQSLYYTALTHPKEPLHSTQPKTTTLKSIQRAIGICDTDTEEEDDKNDHYQTHNIGRRKLSFSNDESESSSTSEFDPGDEVPPKSTIKKNVTKTSREIFKATAKNKSPIHNNKYDKHKSFLASLSENISITNAHPDAKKYKLNYKNNKEDLCNYLFKLYNEKVFDNKLPKDMSIEWNVRMRGTAGFCYNRKSIKALGGVVKSSRIVLATKILDTPDRLRDTLIHEMCHAAAWLINDVSDGHGPFWTGWANKAMKIFPELPQIRRCHDYKIKTKFTYRCVNCGYSIGRHSKSLDIEKKRCGHCYGKFELLINKTTKSGTIQVQTPKREPTAFALYVKENYSTVKKQRNIRHAEIMKILGQQFSEIKIAKKQENFNNDADNSA